MNVVKKAKFVLFFDTFIKDLENQAKDLVSRLKCIIIYLTTLPVAKVLETLPYFGSTWPWHDLVHVNPPPPLINLQDHAQNLKEQL